MKRIATKTLITISLATILAGMAVSHIAPAAEAKGKPAATEKATEPKAEQVEFLRNGQEKRVTGRVIIEAADGGILLESADGVLWSIERAEQQHRTKLDTPFKPLSPTALSEKLLSEMPAGFRSYTTPHYVIVYNTSRSVCPVDQLAARAIVQSIHQLLARAGDRAARAGVPAARVFIRHAARVRPGQPRGSA